MRAIPDPGFAGDDGTASREVVAALAAYDGDPDARHLSTVAVLQEARVLVPVVAVVGEVEEAPGGLVREKTSDMATVLLTGRDGRRALLAFSGTDALRHWDAGARPVPVTLRDACRAAVQDGADALVLDVAGPVAIAVEGDDLRALAEGLVLRDLGGGWGWLAADVR